MPLSINYVRYDCCVCVCVRWLCDMTVCVDSMTVCVWYNCVWIVWLCVWIVWLCVCGVTVCVWCDCVWCDCVWCDCVWCECVCLCVILFFVLYCFAYCYLLAYLLTSALACCACCIWDVRKILVFLVMFLTPANIQCSKQVFESRLYYYRRRIKQPSGSSTMYLFFSRVILGYCVSKRIVIY